MRFIEIQQVLGARHNKHRKTLTALGLTAVAMGLRGAFRRREAATRQAGIPHQRGSRHLWRGIPV